MTDKYSCNRRGLLSLDTGLLIIPSHKRMSIAKKLRVYASNNCPYCDPVRYALFGRKDSNSDFLQISVNDLPWIEEGRWVPRNYYRGITINSSYSSGDESLSYTEISLDNTEAYLDYKVLFLGTRVNNMNTLYFGEIELPGLLMPPWFSSVDIGSFPVAGSAVENPESSGSWIVSGYGWDIDVSLVSREA